ncbi:hypothetical protein CEXT_181361 [Caerostris extrusa]|uniref:Uncharacterized protein n=1 Tax=Caerostris extrusa TaxID=172846 RepID=A0AAV4T598_CAEEX|nr:hypothetical protein CEXT_181361 [Caerostris extrusa]
MSNFVAPTFGRVVSQPLFKPRGILPTPILKCLSGIEAKKRKEFRNSCSTGFASFHFGSFRCQFMIHSSLWSLKTRLSVHTLQCDLLTRVLFSKLVARLQVYAFYLNFQTYHWIETPPMVHRHLNSLVAFGASKTMRYHLIRSPRNDESTFLCDSSDQERDSTLRPEGNHFPSLFCEEVLSSMWNNDHLPHTF